MALLDCTGFLLIEGSINPCFKNAHISNGLHGTRKISCKQKHGGCTKITEWETSGRKIFRTLPVIYCQDFAEPCAMCQGWAHSSWSLPETRKMVPFLVENTQLEIPIQDGFISSSLLLFSYKTKNTFRLLKDNYSILLNLNIPQRVGRGHCRSSQGKGSELSIQAQATHGFLKGGSCFSWGWPKQTWSTHNTDQYILKQNLLRLIGGKMDWRIGVCKCLQSSGTCSRTSAGQILLLEHPDPMCKWENEGTNLR